MKEKIKIISKSVIPYIIAELLTAAILVILYHGVNISEPLIYEGDAIGTIRHIKEVINSGKSVMDMLFGTTSAINLTELQEWLILLFTRCSSNPFLVYNLILLTGFFSITPVSFYVLKRIGVEQKYACILAVLYNFIPYHQLRFVHAGLTLYFCVPIVILFALRMISDDVPEHGISRKDVISAIIWLFLLYASGFYYTAFACMIFVMATFINLIDKKKIKQIVLPLFPIFEFVCIFIIQNIRYFYNTICCAIVVKSVSNTDIVPADKYTISNIGDKRIPGEADVYGLRLMQMLLPRPRHRIGLFASFQERYSQNYPLVNENAYAAMGMIASAVFIIILINLIRRGEQSQVKHNLTVLAFGIFLIGTMGGIGSIFNSVIKNPVRSYNRIGIFIEFICFAYLGMILTEKKLRQKAVYGICLGLLIFGIFDQTVSFTGADQKTECAAYYEDRDFFKSIEASLNDGSTVCIITPEAKKDGGYDDAYRLNLHEVFTDGRIKWVKKTDLDADEIDKEINGDYQGIFVDISVCRGAAADYEKFMKELENDLGEEPIYSSEKNMAFFPINSDK